MSKKYKFNIIQLKYKKYLFNIELRNRIIILSGDTSTGKTLFCNALKSAIINNMIDNPKDIFVFDWEDYSNWLNFYSGSLKSITNSLIIVDNAELLISEQTMKDFISNNITNQYILITRDSRGYTTTPNAATTMCFNNARDEFFLDYPFYRKTWAVD